MKSYNKMKFVLLLCRIVEKNVLAFQGARQQCSTLFSGHNCQLSLQW